MINGQWETNQDSEEVNHKTRGISSVGLEHLPCTQGVKGSRPLFSTNTEVRSER